MKQIHLLFVLLVLLLAACSSEPRQPQPSNTTLTTQDFGTASIDFAEGVAAPKGGVGAVVVGTTTGLSTVRTKAAATALFVGMIVEVPCGYSSLARGVSRFLVISR
jgi:uncharacterized protein YcfL